MQPPPRDNRSDNPLIHTYMARNFRRRVKIIPGVHLNFSKRGISTSIGVSGANVTVLIDLCKICLPMLRNVVNVQNFNFRL